MSLLVIDNFDQMIRTVQPYPDLKSDTNVDNLIKFYHSMLKACNCVRSTLEKKAQDMYARMLPMIQIENTDFFPKLKQYLNVDTIIFKDGDIELLTV